MRAVARTSTFVVAVLAFPVALGAQTVDTSARSSVSPSRRVFTLTPGIGNSMGWLGMQGERYFHAERLSAFAGLGYMPETNEGYPEGITLAGGVRGYTPGEHHRGFLELSISQVLVESYPKRARHYGPGVQAGYQLTTSGGFTLMISGGVGYALGMPAGSSSVGGLFGLGIGYTWRAGSGR